MPKWVRRNGKLYQIYALVDPRDSNICYVGLSADANYRFLQHLTDGNWQEIAWIRELQQLGLSPILQILETVEDNTYHSACEREHYWIQKLVNSGHPLLNIFGIKRAYPQVTVHKQEGSADNNVQTAYRTPTTYLSTNPSRMSTEKYSFTKLLEAMPATQAHLARQSGVNERTIIRMKKGEPMLRSTANRVLKGLSLIYGKEYTLDNVTGINISER